MVIREAFIRTRTRGSRLEGATVAARSGRPRMRRAVSSFARPVTAAWSSVAVASSSSSLSVATSAGGIAGFGASPSASRPRSFVGKSSAKEDGDAATSTSAPASALRKRYSARKIVKGVSRSALCDVVADVDKYSEFLPFCAGARRTPEDTWGAERAKAAANAGHEYFEADLEIGFKVFNEKYTSAVTCERPNKVTARSVSSGLFRSMTTTWKFTPLEGDASEEDTGLPASDGVVVDFEIDFEVKEPMHAAAVSVVFDDVARSQIQAFEARCRSLALLKTKR